MENEIKARILLVEDNEGDIVLTLEALKHARLSNHISIARDGLEALEFLNREGVFSKAEKPDLILMDINLPKINGKELLSIIKKEENLKAIPVIMLTTSDSEKDIVDSYNNYANCYITKPVDFLKFMDVVMEIKNFWVSIVKLPKNLVDA